jgi:hypothetical protein
MRNIFHRILLARPNKPRNFVGVFMLIASFLLKRLGKKTAAAPSAADVLDGEYTVVDKSPISLPR